MTIGIDIRLLGKKHGGIGRYTFELTKNLLDIDNNNKYVLFYNPHDAVPEDVQIFGVYHNCTLVPVRARHYSLAEQTTFLRALNGQVLDLMHFPNFNVPLLYKKPFVVTIHDMVHHKISGAKKSHFLHFYAYKKVIEHAAEKSTHIITVSQYSKKDITDTLHIHPNKITVTYEGISIGQPVDNAYCEQVRKRYLLHTPYFLFVGVLERKKNLINLTRGHDVFLKKYQQDMDLVIVGKIDKHYPDIKQQALDITHADHVVFTGYVEDKELSALYRGAYAYTNASLHEGFGLPGVEAMQFGLPLAVSNTPVFNEIYDNAGVYYDAENPDDIAEKFHLLTRDTQFYQQLQKNSFERAKLFDWKKCAEETIKVYENI